MNKAQLKKQYENYLLVINKLEEYYETCGKLGILSGIVGEKLTLLKKDFSEQLDAIATLPDHQPKLKKGEDVNSEENQLRQRIIAHYERFGDKDRLLANRTKIIAEYNKYLQAFHEALHFTRTFPQSWHSDTVLGPAQKELKAQESAYLKLRDTLRADVVNTKAHEALLQFFATYQGIKNEIANRQALIEASEGYKEKVAAHDKIKEFMREWEALLTALKDEHHVDITKEPYSTLNNDVNKARLSIENLFAAGLSTVDLLAKFQQAIEPSREEFAKLAQIKQTLLARMTRMTEISKEKEALITQCNGLIKTLRETYHVDIEKEPYSGVVERARMAKENIQALLMSGTLEQLSGDATIELEKLGKVNQDLSKLIDRQLRNKQLIPRSQPKRYTMEERFELVQANHKKYLEHTMVTQLDTLAKGKITGAQIAQIKLYVEQLGVYAGRKEHHLAQAMQQLSASTAMGHGALAALLGIGVGGAAFLVKGGSNVFNPLNAVTGAASIGLGVGVSYAAYQVWKKSQEGGAVQDFETFQQIMKASGFDKEYEQLTRNVVGLMHFRECVLLGLPDSLTGANMRKEFIKTLPPGPLHDEAFKVAIEVYFLQQLNNLFTNAFAGIYAIHQGAIEAELAQNPIVIWFKKLFEAPEKREQFTQQLQLQFMQDCITFLDMQRHEPSFIARYPYLMVTMSGLVAGIIALSVASVTLGGPITLGILSIALVFVCIGAVASYLTVSHSPLKYKRDKNNRRALEETSGIVREEVTRLTAVIQHTQETSPRELDDLRHYQTASFVDSLKKILGLVDGPRQIATGSSQSWLREFTNRYRHSKKIVIDVGDEHRRISKRADEQTLQMQKSLVDGCAGRDSSDLDRFIDDTLDYLKDPEHQEIIKNFRLVAKFREQTLEIATAVPVDLVPKLPAKFVWFYTKVLGGSEDDLRFVRQLAPAVITEENPVLTEVRAQPYATLLSAAFQMDVKLNKKENPFILKGDPVYRAMLGLQIEGSTFAERTEAQVNSDTIKDYLDNSYAFLLSLLDHSVRPTDLGQYDQGSFNFIVYRTLLIAQLARLADPNNQHVKKGVRTAIENFVHEKLSLDPKIVLRHALSQTLFTQPGEGIDPKINNPIGVPCSVHAVAGIASAILFDCASSSPIKPNQLINDAAHIFLAESSGKTLFFYRNSAQELIPVATLAYGSKIEQTIDDTRKFIEAMSTQASLIESGALSAYVAGVSFQIQTISQQITLLQQTSEGETQTSLSHVKERLANFATELPILIEKNKGIPSVAAAVVPVLKATALEEFIGAVNFFKESLRGQVTGGLFAATATTQLDRAIRLERALTSLSAGNQRIDLAFLKDFEHYPTELKELVTSSLARMGYRELSDLFPPPDFQVRQEI